VFGVWIGSETQFDLKRAAELWRHFSVCTSPVVFTIRGNCSSIRFTLSCANDDAPALAQAFRGLYPACDLVAESENWWSGREFSSCYHVSDDCLPHRFPQNEDVADSILWPCIEWLLSLDTQTVGFFQCVAQSAGANEHWHRTVGIHHDATFLRGLLSVNGSYRGVHQLPTNELHRTTEELFKKVNPILPLFGVVLRCGTLGESAPPPRFLSALRANGRGLTLSRLSPPPATLRDSFFLRGATCTSGQLLNAKELSVIAHILPCRSEILARTDWPVHRGLVGIQTAAGGMPIGHTRIAGLSRKVAIPTDVQMRSTYIVANSGNGKSTLLVNMFLWSVTQGGAVFIDAHGTAVRDIMASLPADARSRCVFLKPGDGEWTPCWNPLSAPAGTDIARLGGDLLKVLQRLSQHWGDRLATLLGHAIVGLLHVPGTTILDLYNLMRPKSAESAALRMKIIAACPFEVTRSFWQHEFESYSEEASGAPRHKLLRLVMGGPVSEMLSVRVSRVNLREIMAEGKILLVDLSALSSDQRGFLGEFLLTLLAQEAVQRDTRSRPFSIFADEAHQFIAGGAFEDLIAQGRKFRTNVVLAHQYLKQFPSDRIHALLTAGSVIVGHVDRSDAEILCRDFQGKIAPEEVCSLPPFHMVARIGTDIVRFETPPDPRPSEEAAQAAIATIIDHSHARYYQRRQVTHKAPPVFVRLENLTDADLTFEEFD
jgi:hypothetical protein